MGSGSQARGLWEKGGGPLWPSPSSRRGHAHVTLLTCSKSIPSPLEALPVGHSSGGHTPGSRRAWSGSAAFGAGREGAHSRAHLTCWFSGDIGRSFFFAFHLATWHCMGAKWAESQSSLWAGSPLLLQQAQIPPPQARLPAPHVLILPPTPPSADKADKGPAI